MYRTALRLHLSGEQLAAQLRMTSAWSEAAVQVIQQEWNEQVNYLFGPPGMPARWTVCFADVTFSLFLYF